MTTVRLLDLLVLVFDYRLMCFFSLSQCWTVFRDSKTCAAAVSVSRSMWIFLFWWSLAFVCAVNFVLSIWFEKLSDSSIVFVIFGRKFWLSSVNECAKCMCNNLLILLRDFNLRKIHTKFNRQCYHSLQIGSHILIKFTKWMLCVLLTRLSYKDILNSERRRYYIYYHSDSDSLTVFVDWTDLESKILLSISRDFVLCYSLFSLSFSISLSLSFTFSIILALFYLFAVPSLSLLLSRIVQKT